MYKKVYKLRPSDYWRIGEHESWFKDLAAQGLHLKKMGIHFAQFVKGEPKNMRYRIDVSIKKKISPEQIQLYKESGWEYVTRFQFFHVFSSPAELDAPELHTDPAEQAYTLKELDKKLTMNAVFIAVAMVAIIGMMFSIWFLDGTPTFVMIDGGIMQQTILSFFIGYLAYTSFQASRSIRALRKDLVEGKPINHHASWKKNYSFLFTFIVGLSAIIPFVQLAKMETNTLPEGDIDLPIVRLADVEQNPELIRGKPSYMSDNVDWGNRYSYDWSPLAPVQYETDETGVVPGEMWKDGSGEYSPSLTTRVFQLRFQSMADSLVSDLIKRYGFPFSQEDFVETKHPSFDQLIVHEEEHRKDVIAAKGKAVIHVQYFGYADIDSVIKNIEEKMEFF
ncbi:Protein of unknown function [Mesobacillus persicus]|uniref:DUF2812 domain-containing protein n=1 Tax=Mesobacillus persicus TaxID=930146 RepID=A0A1H8KYZ0_9BACI|nr:DUF2812 domain-containing protein [Mesobacillus persicus]SEN98107.1 Protein of unknown function [Mesobacillus persicus]